MANAADQWKDPFLVFSFRYVRWATKNKEYTLRMYTDSMNSTCLWWETYSSIRKNFHNQWCRIIPNRQILENKSSFFWEMIKCCFTFAAFFYTRALKTSRHFWFRLKSLSELRLYLAGPLSPPLFPFPYLSPSKTSFDPRRWKRKEIVYVSLFLVIILKNGFLGG